MGGELVFDWDRLENFLITRDQPVGNIKYCRKYKMPKLSITCANQVYHRLSQWCTDRRQSVCYT